MEEGGLVRVECSGMARESKSAGSYLAIYISRIIFSYIFLCKFWIIRYLSVSFILYIITKRIYARVQLLMFNKISAPTVFAFSMKSRSI